MPELDIDLETEVQDDEQIVDESEESEEQESDAIEEDGDVTEEESDDTEDFFDSEEDYLGQFDLPDKPKTLDDALSNVKAREEIVRSLRAENEALRGGVKDERRDDDHRDTTQKSVFTKGAFAAHADSLVKAGRISEKDAAAYRSFASFNDEVFNPIIDTLQDVLNAVAGNVMGLSGATREASWKRFQHKNLNVSRAELDGVMKSSGIYDYDSALKRLALDSRPDLLDKIVRTAGKRGEERATKKKLRHSKIRGGKPRTNAGTNLKKYIGPDGQMDQEALNRLPIKMRVKVVDEIVAALEK